MTGALMHQKEHILSLLLHNTTISCENCLGLAKIHAPKMAGKLMLAKDVLEMLDLG